MGSTTHHAAEITFALPDNKHGKSRKSDITAATRVSGINVQPPTGGR
jgi:hypothetical protein